MIGFATLISWGLSEGFMAKPQDLMQKKHVPHSITILGHSKTQLDLIWA
jgi:hypothetical protein